MKAHVVGGGLAGLAAAAHLLIDGGVPPGNTTVYEAEDELGGAMRASGGPATGYVLPTGRIFEREFRCAFELFSLVPSRSDPSRSVRDDILAFNAEHPFDARARLIGRDGIVPTQPHFGLSVRDRLDLLRLTLTPEWMLEGRRIEEFFRDGFFRTEFWILWTTMMNALPQHSAVEMRRFLRRFLHLLPDLSTMRAVMRTPYDQKEMIAEPLANWLRTQGIEFLSRSFVTRIALLDSSDRITATSFEYTHAGETMRVEVAPDDIVLVTIGSQAADLSVGSHTEPPRQRIEGRSWALWQKLARQRRGLGRPEVFFGPQNVRNAKWVTFTVTTEDPTFFDLMRELSGVEPGTGGLISLSDSSWLTTLTIFRQPEFLHQPERTLVWWGFILYPDREGDLVRKPAAACRGDEVLRETLHHLGFDRHADQIVAKSTCMPCVLPYAGSVWTARRKGDRPPVVPDGSTNLALIGQFAETPQEAAFTMEYSVRTAREAVSTLLKLDRKPPPPYQGQFDPAALWGALKVLT
jgi:oleate hydratase